MPGDEWDQYAEKPKTGGDEWAQYMSAPNAGLAPPAGPSRQMDSGEGPIAAGLTSFETQLSKIPGGFANYLRHPFRSEAEYERQSKLPAWEQIKAAISPLNPIVRTDPGTPNEHVDIGATAANLAPLAVDIKGGGIGESPIGEAAGAIPYGRIVKAAGAAARGAIGATPIVGPVARGALRAGLKSWRGSAPVEAIDPALTTGTRTVPGMNSPEIIRPPARPIPPRSGLMLRGDVAPLPGSAGSMAQSVVAEPTANMPTPASRAASDAAFAKLHPNEEMPETMTPDAVRAWQESAGFKAEPAEDIGAKVRSQMPALPRGAKLQPAAPGEVSWPPDFKPSTIQRPARLEIATPQDVLETKAIQERARDAAEREDQARLSRERREWFARNAPGKTKGELIQEATVRGQKPEVAAPETDLTESWSRALEDLKAKRGKKPSKGE